ncbi:hypothetical protein A2899_00270 [Candidatus Amesbacteria bacterium RIFCSPLOWO2_01_FULL_49_25]|uniref:Uncharacterized protein n=1 Tax=Candidatus Amesbacteria bacterium RIFCSPHIGHO2_01_FULL_48_32b TaxID=1797253 RepID=A0A1F4YGW5_9BACT|nr:MAG: hypothetical protein A2876_05015 [Candidatus Amesbacteria bacterium RIFCSPHIGHO2_01_FULL_48_32b]OGD07056.1 MAG: hypothetical protein A2899_00270 [Candidatus Amesbacteria bacterium RIFCSPLOWO2_01_FULL_49_25]
MDIDRLGRISGEIVGWFIVAVAIYRAAAVYLDPNTPDKALVACTALPVAALGLAIAIAGRTVNSQSN